MQLVVEKFFLIFVKKKHKNSTFSGFLVFKKMLRSFLIQRHSSEKYVILYIMLHLHM